MTTLIQVIPVPPGHGSPPPDEMVDLLREHEVVVAVHDPAMSALVLNTLERLLPLFDFVALAADRFGRPRAEVITDVLDRGEVPVVVLPSSPEYALQVLSRTLRPEGRLRFTVEVADEMVPRQRTPVRKSTNQRTYLQAVPGGWCTRPLDADCPRTAAEGCHPCRHFESPPEYLPLHHDTALRASLLAATTDDTDVYRINRGLADDIAALVVDGHRRH
ncbi:hypothetical protein [Mangrovihabitans endophyticus]|uniref:Uncharacterized protein n=1 Tax=Mangrovihabitans endophyticus TaxID=1751298 RepID=A0A8J3FMZ1_9ACTN|nr:hypothetical protein [Mangrovihabitans endophyticus]GGK88128.1 hypothetical protein GCM10012284_22760 [Mangrovihabitans endophyticus]